MLLGTKSLQENQSNSQVLAKLIAIKTSNPTLYQFCNKKGKLDKIIADLQKIEKNNPNHYSNPSSQNNKGSKGIIIFIVLTIIIFSLLFLLIVMIRKRRFSSLKEKKF